MDWKVNVAHTDGTTGTYPVGPSTIVAFERQFKIGLGAAFTNEQKLEHVYWLGWHAEKTAGVVVKLFDGWLDTLTDVSLVVDDSTPTSATA